MLAASLAALAGYVDAIGFIELGGLFVSFMTGNSTQLAVGVAGQGTAAGIAALLVIAFVGGVVAGALVAGRVPAAARTPVVLVMVAGLLGAATLAEAERGHYLTAALLATAMGVENNALAPGDAGGGIALTYMTGTLVKLGQRLAAALAGGARWAWLPFLALWSALVGGAALGALVYPRVGAAGIGAAALLALVMAVVARISRAGSSPSSASRAPTP